MMNIQYYDQRTITISKKDIFHDIDTLTLYYSEAAGTDNPIRNDRVATETSSENGARIIKRKCDHRASDIRHVLRKFITSNDTSASDTLETGDWTFNLQIPKDADGGIFKPIADLIHDYIVTGGMADYLAEIGVNGNRESLQARAEASLARIRELIYYRPMP